MPVTASDNNAPSPGEVLVWFSWQLSYPPPCYIKERMNSNEPELLLELEYIPPRRTNCHTVVDGEFLWLGIGT